VNTETITHNKQKSILAFMLIMVSASVMPALALAWTTPAAGSFAYDIYTIGVTNILQGPIGFVAGVASVLIGAIAAITGRIMFALPAILGGAAIITAPTIVNSMGAVI
jgi:hypothetical protein